MAQSRPISSLSKVFITTAFINFLIGAFFGGWMSSSPSTMALLGPLHGEINPFGWLTMMIYGMTYAVLALSTGFRPPRAEVGWIHWIVAELGVVLIVVSIMLNSSTMFRIGLGLQAIAPVIFLGNLLSAVISGKKSGRNFPQDMMSQSQTLNPLKRSDTLQGSDRVGQRGTDVSLMLFLVGVWWIWIQSFFHTGVNPGLGADAAKVLIYYGWIGGTVWSVGLHLMPRQASTGHINAKAASFGQVAWFAAVVIQAVGMIVNPSWQGITGRLLGIAAVYQGLLFLYSLSSRNAKSADRPLFPKWSHTAWSAALVFEVLLGIFLLIGLDPLSLLSMHLLFLGFATSLLYGVGYGLFPWFFGGVKPAGAYAWTQIFCSLFGFILMGVAFAGFAIPGWNSIPTSPLLAVGGFLAAIGAILFLVEWPFLLLRGVKE